MVRHFHKRSATFAVIFLRRSPKSFARARATQHGERGGVLLETAVSVPLVSLVIFVGLQLLTAVQFSFRLEVAVDAGARYAARLTGNDRVAETEAAILGNLSGIPGTDIEFCPVATLTVGGSCPSGAGRRNPGESGDLLMVRAAVLAPIAFFSIPLRLTAVRVIRNEAF